MAAIPFHKSVYGTHFLAGDSGRSRGLDHRAMPGAPVSYRLIQYVKRLYMSYINY